MASTNLSAAQRLQALISDQKGQVGNKIVIKPAFWTTYQLKTVYKTEGTNAWFEFAASSLGENTDKDLREFCRQFALACQRNEITEAKPIAESGGAPKDGDIPI
jgi:hypothetical protein